MCEVGRRGTRQTLACRLPVLRSDICLCVVEHEETTDVLKRLESLALAIAMDVANALRAAIVIDSVGQFLYASPASFRFPPANTLYFAALQALEERSLVHISETVQKTGRSAMGIPAELVTEWQSLVPHRHYLSHPANLSWRDPKVQRFVDEERQHYEIRSALIWQAQQAMNERLMSAGLRTRNTELDVTYAMAVMLEETLRLAGTPEFVAALGTREQCLEGLVAFRDRYVLHIASRTTRGVTGPPVPTEPGKYRD